MLSFRTRWYEWVVYAPLLLWTLLRADKWGFLIGLVAGGGIVAGYVHWSGH